MEKCSDRQLCFLHDHKVKTKNSDYTHEPYNFALDFFWLYGVLFDVAFEHVGKFSSFCPGWGGGYSTAFRNKKTFPQA